MLNYYRAASRFMRQTDPYRANVSLLLHGDGANGSKTIIDSSPTPKTVPVVGNAQISTAQSKFGGASIYFDGINSRATLAGSSDYAMPGNFTVEMWVYQVASSGLMTWFEFGFTNNNEQGIMMRHNQITVGPATNTIANPGLVNNVWTHLAVVRNSSTVVVYKDGTSIGSGSVSSTLTANSGIFLGDCLHSPNRYWNGYIEELCITKAARYTGNFTPTGPIPNV